MAKPHHLEPSRKKLDEQQWKTATTAPLRVAARLRSSAIIATVEPDTPVKVLQRWTNDWRRVEVDIPGASIHRGWMLRSQLQRA